MAEISHLWADWYLFYTLFTPFKVNYPMRLEHSALCRVLFGGNLEETVLKVEINLEETE